ncbi:MAG: hypothetical protein Q9175_000249 [Cornicularia normoerica]
MDSTAPEQPPLRQFFYLKSTLLHNKHSVKMKPTSLVLLFAAAALASPQGRVPFAATLSTPAAASLTATATTFAPGEAAISSLDTAVTASAKSRSLIPKSRATASPSSSSILSTLNAAACKRVIAGNAATLAQIAKLKANGLTVAPYLSGYLIAAKAAEAELGCSGSASASASATASTG